MNYPVLFQAPSQEGVDFSDQDAVASHFSSYAMAVSMALEDLARQINDPRMIQVPTADGRKPLSSFADFGGWYPGDVKLSWGSLPTPSFVKAARQQGFVVCDGRNGTVAMDGAFALGAPTATDPGVATGSLSDVTTGGPSSLINVIQALDCDTQAQAGDESHTHDSDVDGSVKTVTFVFLMRI